MFLLHQIVDIKLLHEGSNLYYYLVFLVNLLEAAAEIVHLDHLKCNILKKTFLIILCIISATGLLPTLKCYAHFCSTYRAWLSAEITDIRCRKEKLVCPLFICVLCSKCTYHKLLTFTSQSCNFLLSFLILCGRIYYRIMFMYNPPPVTTFYFNDMVWH